MSNDLRKARRSSVEQCELRKQSSLSGTLLGQMKSVISFPPTPFFFLRRAALGTYNDVVLLANGRRQIYRQAGGEKLWSVAQVLLELLRHTFKRVNPQLFVIE